MKNNGKHTRSLLADSRKEGEPERQRDVAGWTAVGVISVGCVMLIIAMLLPPPGEIDHSVLVAFGEICTFAGTVFGVSKACRRKVPERPDKVIT